VELFIVKKSVALVRPQEPPRLLRVEEAAKYLSTTPWFIRSLVWAKSIPHVRLGKRILFDRADLDKFIDDQKKAAA
jgi:excisionase family DNA binding protein